MTEEKIRFLESLSEDELLDEKYSDLLHEYGVYIEEKYKDMPPIEPSPEAKAKFEKALDEYFGSKANS